jgi:hypothetical protein
MFPWLIDLLLLLCLDDDVDLGESSDEEVSDNEFSSKKTGIKKNRGFLFDFDNGEVCSCLVHSLQISDWEIKRLILIIYFIQQSLDKFTDVNVKALGKRATQSEIVDSENLEGDDVDDETDGEPGIIWIYVIPQVLNVCIAFRVSHFLPQHLFFVVAFEDNVRKMVSLKVSLC